MQTKITMTYGYTSVKQPTPRTLATLRAGEEVEQQLSFITSGNAKWDSHFGRVWQFLTKQHMLIRLNCSIQELCFLVVPQRS